MAEKQLPYGKRTACAAVLKSSTAWKNPPRKRIVSSLQQASCNNSRLGYQFSLKVIDQGDQEHPSIHISRSTKPIAYTIKVVWL